MARRGSPVGRLSSVDVSSAESRLLVRWTDYRSSFVCGSVRNLNGSVQWYCLGMHGRGLAQVPSTGWEAVCPARCNRRWRSEGRPPATTGDQLPGYSSGGVSMLPPYPCCEENDVHQHRKVTISGSGRSSRSAFGGFRCGCGEPIITCHKV